MSDLPLTGIRVIALEQAVSGPFGSRQLADMGADVIKVERPDGGDFARQYDSSLNGLSAYFAWLNRSKRSITLNLKEPSDLAIVSKLLTTADVFIHNLTPGAIERLGFGYDDLKPRYPHLIWCSISGYGPDGPYHDKKAYDLLIQAESGVISLTGNPESPAKVGISIADISAGLYAYSSILAALFNRYRTNQGDCINISMLECLTEWMMPPIHVWQGTGNVLERAGARHNMIMPYGLFPCADGTVNFAIQNDREWSRFCEIVLQNPDLTSDNRFTTNFHRLKNRADLESVIETNFAALPVTDLIARLRAADIAYSDVNDIPAVAHHPQLAARHRWQDVESQYGSIHTLIPPHNLASSPSHMGPVPALGQHTQEILAELAELDDL
jgi:crotonobetainyl-CoA:carnitine CoA-transferase CaiB-like acyl-CoA transferase